MLVDTYANTTFALFDHADAEPVLTRDFLGAAFDPHHYKTPFILSESEI